MCGISGIVNHSQQQQYNSVDLKAMTDSISHRGPNDVGYLLFDNTGNVHLLGDDDTPMEVYNSEVSYKPTGPVKLFESKEFSLALGHRRLSIIDLSPFGHLPMSYNNGRYWITFNGEIYNYKALKKELELLGHSFVSQTDTEVILASYAQWGIACQDRFNGMWAFSIYDAVTKEIFISRDRFGIKPLYYWVNPKAAFCFASEIKQFTFLPGWKAILNRQRGFDYLMYNMTDHTEETMFKGVFHIPPGHYFKSVAGNIKTDESGKIKIVKWYQPKQTNYTGTFNDAAIAFEKHFKNSVKEHLISDVPVGSALSGGLDSSAIVCEINNLLKEEGKADIQKTFSYCASDERYNEKKWIDEVVKATNVDAHYVSLSGEELFKLNESLIWYNDEPAQSQSLLASFQVYKSAKANNIKVLINGQGADEYLSGYGAFGIFRQVQLLKHLKFKKLNSEISNKQNYSTTGVVAGYIRLCYHLVPQFVKNYFSHKTASYKNLQSVISFKQLQAKQLHPYDSIPYKNSSIFDIAHKQLLHDPLQKYLRYEDRMSMSNSIEARVPFLDHRLVEFTTQLPAEYLDGRGESKKLMLTGLKDIIPSAILKRKDKIGFITSEEKWVKEDFTSELRELLQVSINNSKGIIKPEALTYFDKIVIGVIPFDYTYWRLILFGLWMQKFMVELV